MNRTELIRHLKSLLEATYDTDEYRVKELQAHRLVEAAHSAKVKSDIRLKKINIGDVIANLLVDLLLGGVTFLIAYAAVVVLKFVANWIFNTSFHLIAQSTFLIAIIVGILATFGIFLLSMNDIKENNKKEHTANVDYNKRMEYLQENVRKIEENHTVVREQYLLRKKNLDNIRAKSGLHKDYWETTTLRWLIDILEHGRADSLKEAINLYEHESHQTQKELDESRERLQQRRIAEQQLQELENIKHESTRAADAAEDASRSAGDAAFWSAVTTYLVDKKHK